VNKLAIRLAFVAVCFCGCAPDEAVVLDQAQADYDAYLASDDPLAKAKRDGTFDVLDFPESPRDLFLYRCKFAAIGKKKGYGEVKQQGSWNDLQMEIVWQLPKAPEQNEPVSLRVSVPKVGLSSDEIESFAAHSLSIVNDFDFEIKNEQALVAIAKESQVKTLFGIQLEGFFACAMFMELADPSENLEMTSIAWAFYLDKPGDFDDAVNEARKKSQVRRSLEK
jgi:hypothetical protein